MEGVNDLLSDWDCAGPLDKIRKSAWHPASNPPTEEDALNKHVMCVMADGSIVSINYALVYEYGVSIGPWARIQDVVLMPEE